MNRPPHQSNRLVLFENRWLEQFTVISVGWFVAIWAVIVPLVVMAAWGTFSPLSAISLMLAGWLSGAFLNISPTASCSILTPTGLGLNESFSSFTATITCNRVTNCEA